MCKRLIIIVIGILFCESKAQEFREVNFDVDGVIEKSIEEISDEPNDSDDIMFIELTSSRHAKQLEELLHHKEWHDHLPLWMKKMGVAILLYFAELRDYCIKNWYKLKHSMNK